MLNLIKNEANMTLTENGAATYRSTLSDCLDFFARVGAMRGRSDCEIETAFARAYAEEKNIAVKTLFFARDVRGGLGERRVFRVILAYLARMYPESLRRNVALIPEYGRFDDLLVLLGTPCEADAVRVISEQLARDMGARDGEVSLLAKWLPSVNASSAETVKQGKRLAKLLGMSEARYRKVLAALRRRIRIVENNLREKDYSFDYSAVPSKAMLKYRKAFLRNDSARYAGFLTAVNEGKAKMHTGTLMPYEIITSIFARFGSMSDEEVMALDTTWRALENYCDDENALVVVDGSGSMYCNHYGDASPITVAVSLGLYFAERNRGAFANHFITFSETPRLVEVKGETIAERARYCASFNEVASTNLAAVFELILDAALKGGVSQEEMPSRLYIVSDMEFNYCTVDADVTNFEYAKALFKRHGYKLPEVVFWNVNSRNEQSPVSKNEAGVALVSGCTPRLFSSVAAGIVDPYQTMLDTVCSERYAAVKA